MADVPTTSRSARPRTRRIEVVRPRRPPPDPTHAFGFVLDYQCRLRWSKYFLDEANEEEPCTYTPEEYENMIESAMIVIVTAIPEHVYHALPNLPRVRRDLLPVKDNEVVYSRYVFALRDNSTSDRLHSPLTREHIDAVRKELGLADDEQPKWFRVARI